MEREKTNIPKLDPNWTRRTHVSVQCMRTVLCVCEKDSLEICKNLKVKNEISKTFTNYFTKLCPIQTDEQRRTSVLGWSSTVYFFLLLCSDIMHTLLRNYVDSYWPDKIWTSKGLLFFI